MDNAIVLIGVVSIIAAIISSIKLVTIINSSKWPSIEANISETSIEETAALYRCRPNITFTYDVKGVRFGNNNYDFGITSGTEKQMNTLLGYYPVTKVVTVRYNPANPRQSVLFAGAKLEHYIPLVGSLLFAFICFGSLYGII